MIKYKLTILLCFSLIILSSCWDSTNLEDRGFIIGAGIDIEHVDIDHPEYIITNQFVIPSGLTNPMQGGGNGKAFLNITAKGTSIYQTNQDTAKRTSKVPFFEHLMLLVVSEKVAKADDLFIDLLDTYIRDTNIRRSIKVVVAKNTAKELLDFTTSEERLPSMHINELLERTHNDLGFLQPYVVGELEEFHLNNNSFVLPMLEKKEYIEQNMGAVFHGPTKKMIGTLNQKELEGLEFIIGNITKKVVTFIHNDKVYTFEVDDAVKKISAYPDNDDKNKINVDIKFRLIGGIKVTYEGKSLLESEFLSNIEKSVSEHIKKSMENTIERAQTDLNADIFNIWRLLETKQYDTWQHVKDDWEQGENIFAKTTFNIDIITDIYSIGTSDKTD